MKKRFLLAGLAAVASLSLVGCGSNDNADNPTPTPTPSEPEHVHDYDTEWSKNEFIHWHGCDCDENLLKDVAPHNDEDNDGVCNDCNYIYDANHEHTYSSDWSSDASGHWLDANCGHSLKKDFAEHGKANMLGNCPTCNFHLEDVKPDNVEDAIELGVSQKANVKNGQFKNDTMTVNYEYVDGGLTYSDYEGTYYFYPYGDSVFGVCESTYNGVYNVSTTGKELNGYKFDAGNIGYDGTYLYGAEELLEFMYELGKGNYNGDFKEEVKSVDGKNVYSFSFSDYNANSENYYKYFYLFNVSFTLADSCEIDQLQIDLVSYYDSGYDDDWNKIYYVTLDETTGYYTLDPQAPMDMDKTISYDNNYEAANEKPSYNPEFSVAQDFELSIYNDGVLGDKITDTIEVTAGVKLQIAVSNVTPDTYIPELNEIKFFINGEECDYDNQILYAYNWGDYVQLSGFRAGNYELTVSFGTKTKVYNLVITQPDPTYINATYGTTATGFQTTDEAVEIYAGSSINISAIVNENANAAYTATMNSTDATLTLVEGTDYYTFTSNAVGEYVITVTSSVVPTLTSTITIKVVAAPSATDLLNGTWEYEFYGTKLYSATFTPDSNPATGKVEFANNDKAGIYTYSYDDTNGLVLTYVSGEDYTDKHTLMIKDFTLYAQNVTYGYEYALVKVSGGSTDTGSNQTLEDYLNSHRNWISADGNITVEIEYNSMWRCWSAIITDSVSGTIANADFQLADLQFGFYACVTEYNMIVEGNKWSNVDELEFTQDYNTLTIYFDSYDSNISFTSVLK